MQFFTENEFNCKDGCGCGYKEMDITLLEMLDKVRYRLGEPIIISSAYRCYTHNRNIGGVNNSSHTKGLAVDIKCTNNNYRFKLLKVLFEVGFKRIELAPSWIHVDIDSTKPQNIAFYK